MTMAKMPGVKTFGTFAEAESELERLGGKGRIIAVQSDVEDWRRAPGSGNFATYIVPPCSWDVHGNPVKYGKPFWEWANHGGEGMAVTHGPELPSGRKYTIFLVVPSPPQSSGN